MEAQSWCLPGLGLLLPGPAPSPCALSLGVPSYLARLKVRPGVCSTSRRASMLFFLLSCLIAIKFKAIGANI